MTDNKMALPGHGESDVVQSAIRFQGSGLGNVEQVGGRMAMSGSRIGRSLPALRPARYAGICAQGLPIPVLVPRLMSDGIEVASSTPDPVIRARCCLEGEERA